MSKLRHIAIIVPDPDEARQFFEQAFGMQVVGTARRGIYVSDGTVNIALLQCLRHRRLRQPETSRSGSHAMVFHHREKNLKRPQKIRCLARCHFRQSLSVSSGDRYSSYRKRE